ncbi:hypothetical protein BVC71_09005 [Marivivens niveibacter]|uniref:UPF0235 protein BVC71_09005 n=1 Tax=Marivivens niveibacter TaxID=1930667 RepID=A0A251WX57_9RHOB|nr:DUF167 domain-containing protein [Marivivens niveibacter]OUD08851.1 hypothetical protein BVC71_09005 [Marivivens niveibacter]
MTDLTHLMRSGAMIALRVTPKASRDRITVEGDQIRVYVTAVPENGKANAAVVKLLAKALGVPKSRLTVLKGVTSRDKVIQID